MRMQFPSVFISVLITVALLCRCLKTRLHTFVLFFASVLLLSAVSLSHAAAPSGKFIQDRIGLGFWVDPPADEHMEEHYADIAKANFTFVIGVFGAATPTNVARQLAYCDKYGLKAVVSQAGLAPDKLPTNSSCWGYFLADEPGANAFAGLHQQVDSLH